jgi:hypothetical protein
MDINILIEITFMFLKILLTLIEFKNLFIITIIYIFINILLYLLYFLKIIMILIKK